MLYRRKEVIVDAFLWTGGPDQTEEPEWLIDEIKKGNVRVYKTELAPLMVIYSINGIRFVFPGDWVIHNESGQIYSCHAVEFEKKFELVEEKDGRGNDSGQS